MLIEHRNSQKRIYLDNAVYFITFKTFSNFTYFKLPIFCDLFVEELKLGKQMKQFELYAFNVLYDHVHLLLKPRRKYNISKIMKSLKKNASRDINYVITGRYNVGDTSTCRLHVRGFINECRKKNLLTNMAQTKSIFHRSNGNDHSMTTLSAMKRILPIITIMLFITIKNTLAGGLEIYELE